MLRFSVFTLCFILCVSAFASEIRLKNEPIQCTQTLVALGDVAAVASELPADAEQLRQTVLCTAPTGGEARTLDQAEIRSILSQLGIASSKFQLTGAKQITLISTQNTQKSFIAQRLPLPKKKSSSSVVAANYTYSEEGGQQNFIAPAIVRSTNPLRKDNLRPQFVQTLETQIAEALNVYLASQRTDKSEWNVKVKLSQEQVQVLTTSGQIENITGGSGSFTGSQQFTVQMQKHGDNGQPICVRVEAEVSPLYRAVVLKRSLPRGSLISESDLILKSSEQPKGDFFTDIKEVAGMETTGTVRENSVLTFGMVKKPTWVHKGDTITVRVQNGGIFVRTEGKALQDGVEGDTISVETIPFQSGTKTRGPKVKQESSTFLARICEPKTVEVFASATVAKN
jgi:flagella basal body P-ring formation protein FlgA